MKIVNYILIVILITGSVYGYIKNNSLNNEITHWKNRAADVSIIYLPDPNDKLTIARKAVEVKELKAERDALNNLIKSKDATIWSKNQIIAVYQDSIRTLLAEDGEVVVDPITGDTTYIYNFSDIDSNRVIEGFVKTDSSCGMVKVVLTKDEFIIKLISYIIENKDGTWDGVVECSDPRLSIIDLKPSVVPYKKTWKEKLYLYGGLNIGLDRIGGEAGLGFLDNLILYGIDNNGSYYKYVYKKEIHLW